MADEERDTTKRGGQALLEEIRERYRYACDQWNDIREERKTDMRFISGDPWEAKDKAARAENGRPCINHDELQQYVNQAINALRQNKRGIKVNPAGNGSNEKTAELRQDLIRTVEYRSAAQNAYITAFENALEGSYGFFRLTRRYVSDDSFDQEIVVKNIANPDSVLYDPDCKEADWSDAQWAFVLEPLSKEEFKRRWPDAQVKDFSAEEARVAKEWIQEKVVLTAEYWKIEVERGYLYQLQGGEVVTELPEGVEPVKSRPVDRRQVVQYITNGVEVLERNPQPGELIPIIPVIGKEMYVDEGGGPRRKLFSLVRLARDPQMSLAYLCSQQMEEAGLSPKATWIGYKGQFESDADAWETANKVPHAYLQVDPVVDAAGTQTLPLPQRVPFTPNFIAFEAAKDSCRRAIQSAMGISPLPTAAQRANEKSGIALQRIAAQQAIGSFHFMDNFDRALQFAGRVMDSWIPVVYDTEREMALRQPDESHKLVRINTDRPYVDERTQEHHHYVIADGDHDVTISTGPSYQSQQEAVSDFLDLLVQNLRGLPIAPPQAAKLLSLMIQMKQLGPKGDEMAEIISPTDKGQELPPQAQQMMAAAQEQVKALNAYAQQKEAELQELQKKLDAKVVDNEYRLKLEKLKIEADLAKAEITTQAQQLEERMAFLEDVWHKLQDQAHERGMQAAEQAHAVELAQQQPEAAAAGPAAPEEGVTE